MLDGSKISTRTSAHTKSYTHSAYKEENYPLHMQRQIPTAQKTVCSLLACLLTKWRWVLLEKLTGVQLVKKFPAFYGTRRFITAFTSARHLSLS